MCPADPDTPDRIHAGVRVGSYSSGNSPTPTDTYRLVTPATTILLGTSVTSSLGSRSRRGLEPEAQRESWRADGA